MTSTNKTFLNSFVALVIIAVSFAVGFQAGKRGYTYSGTDFRIVNQNQAPKDVDYNMLWQAMDVLNSKYIDKPLDQQKLLYGAISGMVAAAGDPYTTFFDPQQYSDFRNTLSGSFEGIGAEVGMKNGAIQIVAPLEGSPAQKAGLLSGDIILKINDQDVSSWSLDQTVNKIRGPKGSSVKITVYRESLKKSQDFTITRDTITVASVKYSVKQDNGKPVEYIAVKDFGDDTQALFTKAAQDAITQHATGIILDLRDDGGGYLDAAVNLASYWVDPGQIVVSEQHSDGQTIQYKSQGNNTLHGLPTIVLVNGGTASASEILSGALHDYGFGKLVGDKTFGKGSVQEIVQLPNSTALKVTVAKWLTPKGININHNGLDPDVPIARSVDQIQNNQDPQLDKALEMLK